MPHGLICLSDVGAGDSKQDADQAVRPPGVRLNRAACNFAMASWCGKLHDSHDFSKALRSAVGQCMQRDRGGIISLSDITR